VLNKLVLSLKSIKRNKAMAYIKIKDRDLKTLKVSFLSKDINITKSVREDRIEKFRQNVLSKNGLLFSRYPHVIKIQYSNK
jgi:hypothetical protein